MAWKRKSMSLIFDEVDLSDASVAESSTKNVNNSFTIITPFRRLILCAENRKEMEDWISSLKSVQSREHYEIAMPHQWLEGNLPVSAKCAVCDKTCGSVLRLQDWKCLWCKAMVGAMNHIQAPRILPALLLAIIFILSFLLD
ncbi:hypothetical protein llap_10620 [Limosa lapponica baueri]|uniref:diacylglycerol kinase (ATP) n=1 Tax=Limosa lapponica baueri TaxID=1758121 RepID=A0A2I0TZ68_LIMLA|nr:hypothetical protein llap_10620 [Limosa lapponica baueri]